jgi:hypothetical protein
MKRLRESLQACCVIWSVTDPLFTAKSPNALWTLILTACFYDVKGNLGKLRTDGFYAHRIFVSLRGYSAKVWYWVFKDLPFWARPCGCI